MDSEFSESTYGFALTHEIINKFPTMVSAPPIFPSLVEEGRVGGIDVRIEFPVYPLFLQFKLSEYMIKSSAEEWYIYKQAYFRFKLRPLSKSQQHNLLLKLESKNPNVFYVAPTLNKKIDFDRAFVAKNIIENSIFIRPSHIGILPDDNEHRVIFHPDFKEVYLCSDPKEINNYDSDKFIHEQLSLHSKVKYLEANDSIISLGKELLEIAYENDKSDQSDYRKSLRESILIDLSENPIQTVSYLSRVFFNCSLYLIKSSQ